jgi:hypothetical protein
LQLYGIRDKKNAADCMPIVVTHFFGSHKKNEKIHKKNISKKYSEEIQEIIGARKGC